MAAWRLSNYDLVHIRQKNDWEQLFTRLIQHNNAVSHFFHVSYEEGPFFIAEKCNFDYIQAS
jgi:hypothetical protein